MGNIAKNLVGFVVGLVLGSLVNILLVNLGAKVIPLPEGADVTTMEGLRESMPLFGPANFVSFLGHALRNLGRSIHRGKDRGDPSDEVSDRNRSPVFGRWDYDGGANRRTDCFCRDRSCLCLPAYGDSGWSAGVSRKTGITICKAIENRIQQNVPRFSRESLANLP